MNDQDYILFEDYLSENLTDEKKAAFKNRLQNEIEFKQSFDTYKELAGFLAHKFENEEKTTSFEGNLKNIGNTYFEKKETTTKTIRFKPWQYAMAASITLLISVFSYNLFSVPNYSDFAHYENISLTVRGNTTKLVSDAQSTFNAKNFIEAEVNFTQLLKTEPNNQEIQLYLAISKIELNKFDKAELLLHKISKGNSAFKSSATWYLALSKLKQKDYKTCAEILKTIPTDAADYKAAQKLLKKL